ncbi:hypothetical protein [Rothia nasimurium]|uniref:hypothetical protein n=1 Tax=Rothia nasimurium TaxID=85336 RepID=UPI001F21AA1B|nr:hypothetical protein [Rothia nasimurium]
MKEKEKQQLAFSRGEVPTVIRVMQGILVLSGIAYLTQMVTSLDVSDARGVVSAGISIAITFLLYIWVIRRTGTWQKAGAANLLGFVCTVISTVSLLSLVWVAPPAAGAVAMTGFLVWSLANLTWLGLTFTPVARAFFERVDVIPAP